MKRLNLPKIHRMPSNRIKARCTTGINQHSSVVPGFDLTGEKDPVLFM